MISLRAALQSPGIDYNMIKPFSSVPCLSAANPNIAKS